MRPSIVTTPFARPASILMTMHRLSQGGADRVGVLLCNGFARAGLRVRLALLRSGGEAEREMLGMLDRDVEVGIAGSPMGSRHLELLRGRRFLVGEIGSFAPALVLASSNNMGLVTGLARPSHSARPAFAMKLTNPVVRPEDRGALRQFYRHQLYSRVMDRYDKVLVLSETERAILRDAYPRLADRIDAVPNPYVSEAMLGLPGAEQPVRPPVLLCAARLMPQKRIDILLRAFALVQHPGTRLTILGDGPQRATLERLADSLGIAHRVEFAGFVTDVQPHLRTARLFVLSSDYEGLPAAVIEALACGVPVVTTDCFSAAGEMLAGAEDCALVPRADPAALADAIDRCLAIRRAPSALRRIAEPFTVEASIAAHLAALAPLMATTAP